MQMITDIRKATDEEWDHMVDSVGSAIYFQTREWFDIWSEYAGFENATKLIHFENGKKVLLPLTQRRFLKGLLTFHFLSPKGLGGFLTSDELDRHEKRALFNILQKIKIFYCAVNPHDPLTNGFEGFNAQDSTQVLDLRQGFEPLFKKWTWGHYSRTRKGLREGITVEQASTVSDWKNYYALYCDTMARWGKEATNRYTWDLFDILRRKNSRSMKLWLARHEGQVISGALCFYHNHHVAYWHSATSERFYKKLNATHVLQYFIIKDACEKGFLLYDFLPSSGIKGVIDFKRGFSPEEKRVNIYMSPLVKVSESMRKVLRNSTAYKLLMKDTGF
jgi:lipid II:glycine glycyltransferase (peptidoglycan interpeptide bridge formation enzyme)